MALHVYNTLTRRKDEFVPAHPGVVRLYTCGLTVYSPMHIGHARTYCFWDVFRRYLEYRNLNVMAVINYTDIDDRNMAAATPEHGAMDIAEDVIATFKRDCRALRIKDYGAYTRATDFVAGQIELVKALIEKGHAYVVEGEVFYDIASFPGYGKLSGRNVDEQQVGASGRVAEDTGRKRHPADFTLWKPSAPGQPSWETGASEWPSGRPGWHIECSEMSSATLGKTFDVHGGAVDNLFPHHENEIAQSEPLCGCETWVKYWMHPEHLDLKGEKMSKSIGNVIGIPELLERHSYDEVRWFYAMSHYRSRLSWGDELIDAAAEGYRKIVKLVRVLEGKLAGVPDDALSIPVGGEYASLRDAETAVPRMRHKYTYGEFGQITEKLITRFITAMDDDLNSPQATAALFDYVNELYAAGIESATETACVLAAYQALTRHLYVLGIEFADARLHPELAAEAFPAGAEEDTAQQLDGVVQNFLDIRKHLRMHKAYDEADQLRDFLDAAGLLIEDTPQGARWELVPEIDEYKIQSATYSGSDGQGTLELEFRNGSIVTHIDVPRKDYEGFRVKMFSPAFYVRNIRDKYEQKQ